MGLLDKLWDDIVAGPQPDQGLGRLRRGLNPGSDTFHEADVDTYETTQRMMDRRRSLEFQRCQAEARRVSQSIAIKKPLAIRVDSLENEGSMPSTPTGSTPPPSPSLSSPSGRERQKLWRSLLSPNTSRNLEWTGAGSRKIESSLDSASVYDWIMITALDR